MLTIFTIPKAFHGHIGVIQRNAIRSWTLLRPDCEIILLGNDEGTAEAAGQLGVRHIPDVLRNEFGTPLLDSAFQLAENAAANPFLCYVNADIILLSNFIEAYRRVREHTSWFLMTARRWNMEVGDLLSFESGWEDKFVSEVSNNGWLGRHSEIDFWVYPKTLLNNMPPLAVGRIAFEAWCLYKARMMSADVIDATPVVTSVHQSHDFSHHPGGLVGIGTGIEAQRNRQLVGGRPYFFTIKDRTHVLNQKGVRRARDGWTIWRGFRTAQVLPLSAPLPARLVVRALNNAINAGLDFLRLVVRRRSR